jgi:hypothetical protein
VLRLRCQRRALARQVRRVFRQLPGAGAEGETDGRDVLQRADRQGSVGCQPSASPISGGGQVSRAPGLNARRTAPCAAQPGPARPAPSLCLVEREPVGGAEKDDRRPRRPAGGGQQLAEITEDLRASGSHAGGSHPSPILQSPPDLPEPQAGTDAIGASWHPVLQLLDTRDNLAFDHDAIPVDGIERARSKLEYTTLAAAFCQSDFTVAELRRIYEIVWGVQLDPRNFHRKLTSTDFLEPTGKSTTRDGGRPAAVYRMRDDASGIMNPPLLRKACKSLN